MSGVGKLDKTILIVDPNELNTKLYRDLLVVQGHTVIATKDGTEALALTRQHRPDLILSEAGLGGDITGLDLVRALKADAELKSIPVIVATSRAMKGDEERVRESGCDYFIAIPISVVHFLETIERLLK